MDIGVLKAVAELRSDSFGGPVAQLAERSLRMREVVGSTPIGSTKKYLRAGFFVGCVFVFLAFLVGICGRVAVSFLKISRSKEVTIYESC